MGGESKIQKETNIVLPNSVMITNRRKTRTIEKEISLPFIPTNGMCIIFPIQINGEPDFRAAEVQYCTYNIAKNDLYVRLMASDETMDDLLESGGFTVFRY